MKHSISAAALLAGAILLVGCTPESEPQPSQPAPVATTAEKTPSIAVTAAPLVIPEEDRGNELARVEYTSGGSEAATNRSATFAESQPGIEYAVETACSSTSPSALATYRVVTADADAEEITSGTVSCTGQITYNTASLPEGTKFQVVLDGLDGAEQAYARILRADY
mgnify:CR=1 FL=1